MDNDSGDDKTDELRELGWEEWEEEWSGLGWRNSSLEWTMEVAMVLAVLKSR